MFSLFHCQFLERGHGLDQVVLDERISGPTRKLWFLKGENRIFHLAFSCTGFGNYPAPADVGDSFNAFPDGQKIRCAFEFQLNLFLSGICNKPVPDNAILLVKWPWNVVKQVTKRGRIMKLNRTADAARDIRKT